MANVFLPLPRFNDWAKRQDHWAVISEAEHLKAQVTTCFEVVYSDGQRVWMPVAELASVGCDAFVIRPRVIS